MHIGIDLKLTPNWAVDISFLLFGTCILCLNYTKMCFETLKPTDKVKGAETEGFIGLSSNWLPTVSDLSDTWEL